MRGERKARELVTSAVISALAVAMNAAPLCGAQDTVAVGVPAPQLAGEELPREIAEQIVAFHNSPNTIRFSGRTRLPAQRSIDGDVAILGGPVQLEGRITGDLVVVNGDVTLASGSRIDGNLTVVGGVIITTDVADVGGDIVTYASVMRYRRDGELIVYIGSDKPRPPPTRTRLALPDWRLGDSEIYLSARNYNRVEGLPIAFGPRMTTGGRNPFRIEAFLVWRSESGFAVDEKDIGYEVRATQWLGGHRDYWIETAIQSLIKPIERWQLTNLENSLALFLFRRDYRDYYERQGWYVRLGWRPTESVFGSLEYRDESHRSEDAGSPWTIFFNTEDELQANAAIDGGDLRSMALRIGLDTRNDEDHPWSGWYNVLTVEQALGGSLSGVEPNFTHLFLDLRRYNRVSVRSVLALRFVTGGRTGGRFLPAQRQHVIGGAGSLPGYNMREFDCGARADPDFGEEPGYGCQRFALFQAEYRTGLDFRFRWDRDEVYSRSDRDIFAIDFTPSIVLLYDAGAAWATDEGFFDHLTELDNWVSDIGAGVELGGLGFYIAYPLEGSGGVEGIVRLTGRF